MNRVMAVRKPRQVFPSNPGSAPGAGVRHSVQGTAWRGSILALGAHSIGGPFVAAGEPPVSGAARRRTHQYFNSTTPNQGEVQ